MILRHRSKRVRLDNKYFYFEQLSIYKLKKQKTKHHTFTHNLAVKCCSIFFLFSCIFLFYIDYQFHFSNFDNNKIYFFEKIVKLFSTSMTSLGIQINRCTHRAGCTKLFLLCLVLPVSQTRNFCCQS